MATRTAGTSTSHSSTRHADDFWQTLKRAVRWTLFAAIVLYVVTGLGITEYRTVEHVTFGLLTKSESFRIHQALLWPFVGLVVAHIALPAVARWARRR